MVLKCCTQYVSKFGKLNSGHRIEKGQFSFQFQRRSVPKNAQTTSQLHLFHVLVGLCSKPFKLGLSSMCTENFQMYKLDLENAEELEIKLPVSIVSEKKQENSKKKIYYFFIDSAKNFVWITTNCGKFFKRWEYQTTLPGS